jgi:Zn-dependent M16 (insulinase) family peptidase
MDAPMTPSMKGERATGRYLSHLTFDEVQLERDEVLKTSQEAIRKHAELIDAVMKENNICTLGNEGKIKQNKNLFNTLVNVFE